MRVLVTGGARSGKSTYAEGLVGLRDVRRLRRGTPQATELDLGGLRRGNPQATDATLRDVDALRASTPQGSDGGTYGRVPEEGLRDVRRLRRGTPQATELGDRLEGPPVDYVATGYPASVSDPDWAARVQAHQDRRPASWNTIETLDVAGVLRSDSLTPVLVDCMALWLTRTADEVDAWSGGADAAVEARVADLVDALARTTRDVVLVTNEVGLGVVPDTSSGRWFRDALGRLNIALAATCDEVWLCVAGIPVAVKHG